MEIYLKVIKDNYVNFNGRARRKEFWMFQLFVIIITVICTIFDNILGTFFTIDAGPAGFVIVCLTDGYISYVVFFIFCHLCSLLVRRLHDVGKSGWWYFIGFIPF